MRKLFIFIFFIFSIICKSQESAGIKLIINQGVESSELQDLLKFKEIDYFTIIVTGEELKGKKFAIVSKEYWDKDLKNTDTIADLSKTPIPGLNNDTLITKILAEKSDNDSLRISFNFKRLFGVTKKYKTTTLNTYSTRNLSNGKNVNINLGESFPLLVYTLPYENPEYPGWLFYCELTRDGVATEDWGEKYNLKHYVVFEMIIY